MLCPAEPLYTFVAPSFIWMPTLTVSAAADALMARSVTVKTLPFMPVAAPYIKAPFPVLTSKVLIMAPESSQLPETISNLPLL